MDGADYTFNGWGEYILTEIGNFTFQGRTEPVNASAPGSATQFSALAFGIPDAVVEVSWKSSCSLNKGGYTVSEGHLLLSSCESQNFGIIAIIL